MRAFKIAVIGLGYVGLPLAVEFAKKYSVTGFDINELRIRELTAYYDRTLEVTRDELRLIRAIQHDSATGIVFSSSADSIKDANIYIITVPTPVDHENKPDLRALFSASEMVGAAVKKGDIIIYESTVYPGLTEGACVPLLEKISGLQFNTDFFVGYSPERINPGDRQHSLTKVKKVTAGSTVETAITVDELYRTIITAGTHRASSIKVAEASKVVENAQRDINIAFINELSKIFNHLGIDTGDVLAAAGTKWNFLPFKPGLVGGHCIGIAPYYLAHRAIEAGYHPEIILAGRRLNDGMGTYVADEIIKLMLQKGNQVIGSKALVLGFTFKENCPDIRNTKVIDIINQLKKYHLLVDVYDPWADPLAVRQEYAIDTLQELTGGYTYDAIIVAVSHREFTSDRVRMMCNERSVVYDVKGVLHKEMVDGRL